MAKKKTTKATDILGVLRAKRSKTANSVSLANGF